MPVVNKTKTKSLDTKRKTAKDISKLMVYFDKYQNFILTHKIPQSGSGISTRMGFELEWLKENMSMFLLILLQILLQFTQRVQKIDDK